MDKGVAGRLPYLIFADLDGIPRDERSEIRRAAESALEALRARRARLVACSSATRAEVEVITSKLGIREPFIVENGGAILMPSGFFPFPVEASQRQGIYDVIRLGVPYKEVVAGLRRAGEASGCPMRSFYDMPAAEVAAVCEMDPESAARAKQREYDEPFQILTRHSATISSFLERIQAEGLSWTRGKLFYHARGKHNKGQAAKILAALYRRLNPETVTVGIGERPNDLSLLDQVDVPILLRWGARRWSDAILELLQRSDAAAGGGGDW